MKKIIVVGNSIAGIRAIEEIRSRDRENEITVFCEDNNLPNFSHLFAEYLSKVIPEDEIFYKPQTFYKEKNINIFLGRRISRVDLKRKRVITEEREQFFYDILLVADSGVHRFPEIKGANKMGVFGLRRLGDIKDILAVMHLVDTVIMEADSVSGLKMAQGLKKRSKEVVFIIPSGHLLFDSVDRETAEILSRCLEENGICTVKENTVSEILGEGEVKAVRLKTGKVLASQMAVMAKSKMDLRMFADSSLEIDQGILVDEFFRTNVEDVFAVNGACQPRTWEMAQNDDSDLPSLEEQGRVAGLNICNQATAYQEPLRIVSFELFSLSIALMGKTKTQDGILERSVRDAPSNAYQKIFVQDRRLVGAVMINAAGQQDKIVNLIREKIDIQGLEDRILEASCTYAELLK